MILLIDNYDSFSFNLYQLVGSIEPDIRVIRNDAASVEEIRDLGPQGIILSPGPGRPEDAGICIRAVQTLGDRIPILGVCLGHQAIVAAFGGKVGYAKTLMHGKQSLVELDVQCPIFRNCSEKTLVARYHSLAADREALPAELKITGVSDDGEIMGVKHRDFDVYGVQFHPESIMTPEGENMLQNFVDITRK